jgi:chromosomal replication initiator protein
MDNNKKIVLEIEYNPIFISLLQVINFIKIFGCKIRIKSVSDLIKVQNKEISIDLIQIIICKYFNISVEQLHSNVRKREIVQPRQIAHSLCMSLTKSSLATVGQEIGKKDHATVLNSCRTVKNLCDTESKFRSQYEEIEKRLKG